MKSSIMRSLRLLAILVPFVAACDEDTTEPEPLPVPAVIVVSGNTQTGVAGTTLSQQLTVRITATTGVAIAGQQIRARVTEGGGSISPEFATTGSDGTASTAWTLGPVAGAAQKVVVEALSATGAVVLTAEAVATAAPGPAATIVINPASLARFSTSGRTVQLTAAARDALGNAVAGAITWQSADTLVATVSSTGLVRTGTKSGTAVIIARSGAAAATVNVEVSRVPANVVVALPANVRAVRIGEFVQFAATATDSAGAAVDAGFAWVSMSPARATIDANGRLQAVSAGWAVVEARATAGVGRDSVFIGPDATMVITLLAPGDTLVTADSTDIRVRVQTTRTLQSVQATLGGVTKTLTAAANNEFTGRFATASLAIGSTPIAIEARATFGFYNTLTRNVVIDRPVTLTVTAPTANATYSAIVPINVTCTVAGSTCTSVTVVTSFGATLTGTTSVSGNIVAPGGAHSVRITGRSATRTQVLDIPVTVILPAQPIVSWAIESGGNQTGLAGAMLFSDIVLRAVGVGGVLVPNMPATVNAAAGTVEAPLTTDPTGRLRVRWRLGNTAGAQKFTVSAVGTTGFVTTEVFALALAGGAAQITLVSGGSQTVATGQLLPQPVVVRVTDAVGNPVSNATVSWQVLTGGGQITATSQTDDDGRASAQWRVGTTGTQSAQASIVGGASVSIGATAGTVSVARTLDITPDSLVFYTRARPQPLTATVRDQYGHPMAATIAWQTTNANIVSVPVSGSAQAETQEGTVYLIATSGGLRDSVRARVHRYPAQLELRAVLNNRQVVTIGDSVRIIVDNAADSAGYPILGAVLTFTPREPTIATAAPSGWVRGVSDGETIVDVGVAGTTAKVTRTIRVGPDPAIDIAVGVECIRGGLTLRCVTVNPATELITVNVTYAPSTIANIAINIGGRTGSSATSPVSVSTSGLAAGEYAMYVRVTMANGRYGEVQGIAIVP